MKIKTFVFTLIMVILSACSVNQQPPLQVEKTPAFTLTPLKNVENNLVTPTPSDEQTTPIVENLSSSRQNIDFQALNMQPGFRLVVRNDSGNLASLDAGTNQIQSFEISGDPPELYSVKASPDGMHIAYIGKESDDRTYINISTISGHKLDLLWKVKVPKETILVEWLNNQLLGVWGQSSRLTCPDSVSLIDLATGTLEIPKHTMPTLQYPAECIRFPALSPDGTKFIYPGWNLFDFSTGKSMKILSDIQGLNATSPTINFKWAHDGISILDLDNNTLNYVFDVPLENLPNQNASIKRIFLPGIAETAIWSSPIWWSLDGNLIGVDLVTESINIDEYAFAGQSVPTTFFVIDLKTNIIRNYNLDRAVVNEEGKAGELRFSFLSPDGKFLAWTVYDLTSGTPIATKILDLSNATTALIKDVEVLGWGIEAH